MNFNAGFMGNNQNIPDDITEDHKIVLLEQRDREMFINDVKELMNQFVCLGVSKDMSAYLAATFYNDPAIKARRKRRRESGNKQKEK